jgi:hypothetical protein
MQLFHTFVQLVVCLFICLILLLELLEIELRASHLLGRHLSHISSPCCFSSFSERVLRFCPDWPHANPITYISVYLETGQGLTW